MVLAHANKFLKMPKVHPKEGLNARKRQEGDSGIGVLAPPLTAFRYSTAVDLLTAGCGLHGSTLGLTSAGSLENPVRALQ